MVIDPDNTFFFSDPHFDHRNIIRYCDRPFKTVEEMNQTILRNYHSVVRADSTVYFLGDMAFGRDSRLPKWWLTQLAGNIIYIKGSHDKGIRPTNSDHCYNSLTLDTGKDKVLLIHSPWDIPKDWRGWTIHGHTHSTTMVDRQRRKVCVCVEATNYYPITLTHIREAITATLYDSEEVERAYRLTVHNHLESLKRDHYNPDLDG